MRVKSRLRVYRHSSFSQLAKDEDVRVRTQACAGLCNLLLDFSPVKRSLLDSGLVSMLVQYAGDPNPELRLNATWALKNALYKAEPPVKDAILRELTLTSLQRCVFGRLCRAFRSYAHPQHPLSFAAVLL